MDNKEILEEIRKENEERMTREKRYKVLKVERYNKEIHKNSTKALVLAGALGILSIINAYMFFGNISPYIIESGIIRALGNSIGGVFITSEFFILMRMLETIARKVGFEQKVKDIELELEVDKQIEEEQQGKVKKLSLENDNHGIKH